MKLNGWHRIGIILSVCWMIGAVVHTRNAETEFAGKWYQAEMKICLDPELTSDTQACMDAASDSHWKNFRWTSLTTANVAFNALGPVIAGWILAFVVIRIVRWVRRGFAK